MPLQSLARVTITLFDGQALRFDEVTMFEPVNTYSAALLMDPEPFESRVRLVTLERGDLDMDGRLVASVVVECDGLPVQRIERTVAGLQEV